MLSVVVLQQSITSIPVTNLMTFIEAFARFINCVAIVVNIYLQTAVSTVDKYLFSTALVLLVTGEVNFGQFCQNSERKIVCTLIKHALLANQSTRYMETSDNIKENNVSCWKYLWPRL